MKDIISREAAIGALLKISDYSNPDRANALGLAECVITTLPSEVPTIKGYDIRYLEMIAAVLQEEGLPPERVNEAITDIGRIVEIVANEFKKQIRKAIKL